MNILIKNKIFILAFLGVFSFLLIALPKTSENPVREYQKYYIEKTTGELIILYLEESITRDQMNLGLMYRESLPPSHGMIFIFAQPDEVSFWMKNTYISLDLIMADNNGNIVEIHQNQSPQSLRPINSKTLIKYVIELQAGEAKKLGIKIGDKLDPIPKTNH